MRERNKYLLDKLERYGKSDFYPFHMPGHKRQKIDDCFAEGFPDPYSIDITEIEGFDNLHHPEGILKESMEEAARIYGTDKTYYLVNGSTCGILAAICGCTDWGGRILMARNCHKSAYHGLLINGLTPEYLYPEHIEEYGINGGICPDMVKAALERNRKSEEARIQAVLLVSPTYEGIVSDIRSISDICHEYGVPLLVDEAHGAHLPFAENGSRFPVSALNCGADLVIQSLHKTLPSFTQTAVLHLNGELVDREKLERYLGIFQSSSPSYLFMAAMERCIWYMDDSGREKMRRYENRMESFYKNTGSLHVLKVLDHQIVQRPDVFDWDMSKIVITTKRAEGVNGEQMGNILRENYHIEAEMCAPDYVVLMTSLMDTENGLLRLEKALSEIDKMVERGEKRTKKKVSERLPEPVQAMSVSEAMRRRKKKTDLSESAGKISMEFVYLYPPGIPILVPGEMITEEITERIHWYKKNGFEVQGLSDPSVSCILTVAED